MEFFLNSESFPFRHKRNFNPKVIYELFSVKTSADVIYSSSLVDSLLKTSICSNFSVVNSFLFLTDFEM